jgi:HD-GYP domain-containing protein (c-di-GMP phosphodiesterase class II)
MLTLEQELEASLDRFKVKEQDKESIKNHLSLLKAKDNATYEHSIRVGILAGKIGEYMHLDPKALLFAGTLHKLHYP